MPLLARRKSHFRGIKRVWPLAIVGSGDFQKWGRAHAHAVLPLAGACSQRSGPFLKGLTAITKKYME
ncbi:hypothetical protein F7234_17745 [Pseudomonas putida]|uniref:Uncharacterized protein n=1 Tax=Pseudomonas putida TaxID=303 RepID=A0AAD0LB42_PSEPU|nr:hypothetical protein C1S65_04625 [Pseudomonas putida]KAB5621458.1 hypothetical protein F7234_17745 [Pseudomonas putida]RSC29840.1 hypothetical protein EGT09_13895 [Pseudomonas putida]